MIYAENSTIRCRIKFYIQPKCKESQPKSKTESEQEKLEYGANFTYVGFSHLEVYGQKRNIPRESARRALQTGIYPIQNWDSHLAMFPR